MSAEKEWSIHDEDMGMLLFMLEEAIRANLIVVSLEDYDEENEEIMVDSEKHKVLDVASVGNELGIPMQGKYNGEVVLKINAPT